MKNNTEIWKDIIGYEGIYQVSSLGKVRSLDRSVQDRTKDRWQFIKGKNIRLTSNGKNYYICSLMNNGVRKNNYIHRLVAQHFIDNPNNYKCVNHLDFNTKNNSVGNLEWCDVKQNINYSIASGRTRVKKIWYNPEEREKFIQKVQGLNNSGITKKEICRRYKVSYNTISRYVNLKNWGTKGISRNNKPVKCINTGEIFKSIKDANKKYKVTTIKDAISGRQKTSAGMRWEFVR